MKEYKIHNADVTLNEDATTDQLIDVIEGNRIYIPAIYVLNKIDQISIEELDLIYKIPHTVPISAHHKVGHIHKMVQNNGILVEFRRSFGDHVGLFETNQDLHEAKGREIKIYVASFTFHVIIFIQGATS